MMPGGAQVAQRCYSCGTTPPLIDPPVYPGSTNLIVSVSSTFNVDSPEVLLEMQNDWYCDTTNETTVCSAGWVAILSQTSNASIPMTQSIGGSYSAGVRYYSYTGSGPISFGLPDYSSTVIDLPAGGDACTGQLTVPTAVRSEYFINPAVVQTLTLSANFTWLGTAQRDLYGIRIRRKTGTDTWYFSCTGGRVKIENEAGTKSYESPVGTLQAAAVAINASSIGGEIEARATYMWTSSGEVSSGTITEWGSIFNRNDQSTILKDVPVQRLNTTCTVPNPPALYSISSGVPVYRRGEILPPRGIVEGKGPPFMAYGIASNKINEKFATQPSTGFFSNTESGALQFIQTTTTFTPTGNTSTAPWFVQGIFDPAPGAPGPFSGASYSGFESPVPVETGAAICGSRTTAGSGSIVTTVNNRCPGGVGSSYTCSDFYEVVTFFGTCDNTQYCCPTGDIPGPCEGQNEDVQCGIFYNCTSIPECCGSMLCNGCSRNYYKLDGFTAQTSVPCEITTVTTAQATWRIG